MEPERWSTLATRVLAPNPSRMTLEGTNTFVIRAPGETAAVVVDPGPEIAAHLDRVAALGPISLVLLTHRHHDHSDSIATISARTGAPVRAFDPAFSIGAPALRDGEAIDAAGTRITVIATPGHTADSVCFHLPDDAVGGDHTARVPASGSLLTGDTILGRGTTIIARPDGSLRTYLRSLEVLQSLAGDTLVLPGHGPALRSLAAVTADYVEHRRQRLGQVAGALRTMGVAPTLDETVVASVTDFVYPNIHRDVRFAAEMSTYAQLDYLLAER